MSDLSDLAVLSIDCQATHSNPNSGHLIEIGWVKTKVKHPFDHEMTFENTKSLLVKTEKQARIPRQFSQITGIGSEEMKEAVSKKAVWEKLSRAAKKTSSENRGICPAVIHFSRYEGPYLEQLHNECTPNKVFPFTIICTHEIVSRLYPGLPRKGLRAVAGYYGYALPEFRRSLHHVVATAFIWNHLVRHLEEKEKITAFTDFWEWLHNPPARSHSNRQVRKYPMEKALREDLPDKPGIYRMYRSSGDLLYIGKAKSLKHRVNSYFHTRGRHAEHILEMLSQAQNLTTSVTPSALEAAVRESDEIKRLSPPYNRALRRNEQKLQFYAENFRHKRTKPDSQHPVGPFPSNIKMESLATLIDALNGKIRKFSPRTVETILLTHPGYAPDEHCFELGFEAYKCEYMKGIPPPVSICHMMKWGTQFWHEKLADKERERQEEEGQDMEGSQEEEDKKELEDGWTPERVFKALKRMIRIGSFQIRRARWFCRLSESALLWPKAENCEGEKHILVIENGITKFENIGPKSDEIVLPPGHKKTLRERQGHFDIATYDRMRIVTTEMRRLIQEGRELEVRFHPGVSLKTERLAEILKWV